MAEKKDIKTISEEEERAAFANGLQITKFFALFNYFLQETPEGQRVKQEMNQAWRETFELLKNNKQLRGNEFSCSLWLKQVQKELLKKETDKNKEEIKKENEEKSEKEEQRGKSEAKKPMVKKVRPLRFKNV